jgi:hypothetical protein
MSNDTMGEGTKRALIKAKITAGNVFHVFCNFITPPDFKYVVVLYKSDEDDFLLISLINSEINQFIEKDPALKTCQVKLLASNYTFLRHDSYLNCAKVFYQIDVEDIVDHLLVRPQDHKGCIIDGDKLEIIQAIIGAKTLSEIDKNCIVESLGN